MQINEIPFKDDPNISASNETPQDSIPFHAIKWNPLNYELNKWL